MAKYKVTKKCYFGEKGAKPRLMYPGEIYISETLKDVPSCLELIKEKSEVVEPVVPAGDDEEMSYQEMKSFVIDNEIEVPDQKKETLIKAIEDFKNQSEDESEDDEEIND